MNFAVLQFPGSNCDQDVVHVLRNVLGHSARLLWHKDSSLGEADAVIVPGGFSYGDYLRTGAIARFSPVMEAVQRFAADGGLVLGHLQWVPDSLRGRTAARGADSQSLPSVPVRAYLPEDGDRGFAVHQPDSAGQAAAPADRPRRRLLLCRRRNPGAAEGEQPDPLAVRDCARRSRQRPPTRTARSTTLPASATSSGMWRVSCRIRNAPASQCWDAPTGAWCSRA